MGILGFTKNTGTRGKKGRPDRCLHGMEDVFGVVSWRKTQAVSPNVKSFICSILLNCLRCIFRGLRTAILNTLDWFI